MSWPYWQDPLEDWNPASEKATPSAPRSPDLDLELIGHRRRYMHEQANVCSESSKRKEQEEFDEENCGNPDSSGGYARHIGASVAGRNRGGDIAG